VNGVSETFLCSVFALQEETVLLGAIQLGTSAEVAAAVKMY
jgi:hypothetical protein